MIFFNYDTPITLFASALWSFCEYFEISLGKHSPMIFGLAMGKKGKMK
jgi:hypothetical protein